MRMRSAPSHVMHATLSTISTCSYADDIERSRSPLQDFLYRDYYKLIYTIYSDKRATARAEQTQSGNAPACGIESKYLILVKRAYAH